uniref:Uncharacterized protein n=1 Tax=Arundo donax TaxID=35708 RepID=A0A0A9ALS6_ARUDO
MTISIRNDLNEETKYKMHLELQYFHKACFFNCHRQFPYSNFASCISTFSFLQKHTR